MKIVVLNGSPKGNMSVTLQYVLFIRKKFPQHELKIFNIAQEIRKIEGEEKAFQEIIEAVKSADGVLWAFPLYFLLVHSNYKRFIELISERKAEALSRTNTPHLYPPRFISSTIPHIITSMLFAMTWI